MYGRVKNVGGWMSICFAVWKPGRGIGTKITFLKGKAVFMVMPNACKIRLEQGFLQTWRDSTLVASCGVHILFFSSSGQTVVWSASTLCNTCLSRNNRGTKVVGMFTSGCRAWPDTQQGSGGRWCEISETMESHCQREETVFTSVRPKRCLKALHFQVSVCDRF